MEPSVQWSSDARKPVWPRAPTVFALSDRHCRYWSNTKAGIHKLWRYCDRPGLALGSQFTGCRSAKREYDRKPSYRFFAGAQLGARSARAQVWLPIYKAGQRHRQSALWQLYVHERHHRQSGAGWHNWKFADIRLVGASRADQQYRQRVQQQPALILGPFMPGFLEIAQQPHSDLRPAF